jgi:hypothetical protein
MCKLQMPYLSLSFLGISQFANAGLIRKVHSRMRKENVFLADYLRCLLALIVLSYICLTYLLICCQQYIETRGEQSRALEAVVHCFVLKDAQRRITSTIAVSGRLK